ncbi:MAG: glycosyl hydrolase, partial [Actinomycetota bacterium]|nr:glycosyl hydrolase [Actinomycetota bacterium]
RLPQSIGAIAQAPDGTLYVGTGETNPGGGSLTYHGDGVYKSTDRGQTWQHMGLDGSSTIGRIVVDPGNSNHVWVAVSGDLFAPGGERGLYETRDGGATWNRILAPPNETTGAADVAVDPENPNNILVAMWDHIRYPDVRYYTGEGSGIWRSTDGGATFTRLGPANGLPPAADNIGRIGVAFDPQSSRAYAIYANNEVGAFQAWFVSVNDGANWVAPPGNAGLAASQSVYGWWFARVWVDPTDTNHVFIAGLMLYESINGGMSFAPDTVQHVDQHAMAWDPRVEGRVYSGNDGGVYRSDENGANGSWVLGDYMPWSQFFTLDVSETSPSRINGGLQDQGSVRSWGYEPEEGEAPPPSEGAWDGYYGGDGVKNAINPQNEQIVFACSQYGSCGRSENGGDDMEDISNSSSRFGWLTPIEFQPGNPSVMYWAGSEVNRSEDAGETWTSTSPDLGKGEGGREINPLYANHYGSVQAIGLSPSNPEVIYAGTDNGYLWKSTDRGASWTELTPDEQLPASWVTHITVHPRNPDVVYLTYGGYHGGDETPYVFLSRDGGQTWKNLSGNLPQAPVQDLVLVRGWKFVATDVGIFVSGKRRPKKWFAHGRLLPNVPVNDIRYVPANHTLYAGTFGRGIYKIHIPKKKNKQKK